VEHLFKAIRVVHRGEMWATSRVIAQTMTELAAATRLGITEATVKAHLSQVFQKLAIRGRAQLAAGYARLPLDT
jgi:DNA-binding CsgD family transcriptional regulator